MSEPAGGRFDRLVGVVALVIAAVLTLIAGVRLIGSAGTSIFFVDECWHALVARMMADAKGLVTSTTEMMAERFHMDYPPLFHLLNAEGYRWLGSTSLVYFNLVAAALLALILIGP